MPPKRKLHGRFHCAKLQERDRILPLNTPPNGPGTKFHNKTQIMNTINKWGKDRSQTQNLVLCYYVRLAALKAYAYGEGLDLTT